MAADPCTEDFFSSQSDRYQIIKAYFKREKLVDQTPPETPALAPAPGLSVEEVTATCDAMATDVQAVLEVLAGDHASYYRVLGMRGALLYEKARLLMKLALIEESHQSLSTGVDLIVNHALKPELSFLVLRILNHFAYSLAANDVLDMSLLLLEQAENIYFMIRTKSIAAGDANNAMPPIYYTADDLFSPGLVLEAKPETGERLERLVTNNFQMMTFIYSRVEREDLYNAYQNRVLNRQLQMREGDALNWAGKTTKLAQGFLQKAQFENARTHLAAASDVLHEYHADLKKMDQTEATQERLALIDYRAAELGRTWVKYALTLFSRSKHVILDKLFREHSQQCDDVDEDSHMPPCEACGSCDLTQLADKQPEEAPTKQEDAPPKTDEDAEKETTTTTATAENKMDDGEVEGTEAETQPQEPEEQNDINNNIEAEEGVVNESINYEIYTFPTLDTSYIESRIQAHHVTNTIEARALFTFTQPWLKRTMSYYNIHDHPVEYVNCILDLSELYRYLAFYEEDTDSQYNVQKRRADTLETLSSVLREGNPGTYIGASVELYRELAEVQIEMLGLNLRRMYAADAVGVEEALSEVVGNRAQWEVHKLQAVKDIHGRLREFGTFLMDAETEEDGRLTPMTPTTTPTTPTPGEPAEAAAHFVAVGGDDKEEATEVIKEAPEVMSVDADSSGDADTITCKVDAQDTPTAMDASAVVV